MIGLMNVAPLVIPVNSITEKGHMSDLMEKIKSIIAEQLNVDEAEVQPEAHFIDDLGADSLDTVELVMALEEEFGVEISDEDAEKIQTVGDVMKYIEQHKG